MRILIRTRRFSNLHDLQLRTQLIEKTWYVLALFGLRYVGGNDRNLTHRIHTIQQADCCNATVLGRVYLTTELAALDGHLLKLLPRTGRQHQPAQVIEIQRY